MNRPLLTATATELVEGTGISPVVILEVISLLLPMLQECAGTDVAGWLAGDNAPVKRKWAAARREKLVRHAMRVYGVPDNVADRVVIRLKAAKPDEMEVAYREAG